MYQGIKLRIKIHCQIGTTYREEKYSSFSSTGQGDCFELQDCRRNYIMRADRIQSFTRCRWNSIISMIVRLLSGIPDESSSFLCAHIHGCQKKKKKLKRIFYLHK